MLPTLTNTSLHQFKNVWLSETGDLISKDDCTHIVREKYSYTFREINNSLQLRATIRNGKTAWPGGYPLYLVFGDGEPCCFDCARKEYSRISKPMVGQKADRLDPSAIIGCDINWEDNELFCAHCNNKIESAYGETNEKE